MNLKEAAREIGVHYQTAYKWVRSGELAAVRIGNRYEVTDAAVERFVASRRAVVGQAEIDPREHRRVTDVDPEDFLEELEAMAADPIVAIPSIEGFAARGAAATLGDVCIIRISNPDGETAHVLMDHVRPDRAAFYNALVGLSGPEPAFDEQLFAAPMARGESVLHPIVDQIQLRRAIQPELRQYLTDHPMFSIVGAPVVVAGTVRGSIMLSRDTPSSPYGTEQAAFVRRVADRIGTLVRTADEIELAWRLRSELVALATAELGRRRPGLPFTGAELQDLLYGPASPGALSALPSITLSPDDRILAINGAAERLFGYTPRELHGRRRDEALLPKESLEGETDAHARLRSGEVDFHDSHALRLKADGNRIDLAVHRGAVRDHEGALACVVGVARELHLHVHGAE